MKQIIQEENSRIATLDDFLEFLDRHHATYDYVVELLGTPEMVADPNIHPSQLLHEPGATHPIYIILKALRDLRHEIPHNSLWYNELISGTFIWSTHISRRDCNFWSTLDDKWRDYINTNQITGFLL